MSPDVSLAPFEAADFEDFYALRRRTMEPHFAAAGKNWLEEDERATHTAIAQSGGLLKILRGCERAGYVHAALQDGLVRLSHFCIAPEQQNHGIGTAAMKRLMERHPTLPFRLDILRGNRALRLYERLGFFPVDDPTISPKLQAYISMPPGCGP